MAKLLDLGEGIKVRAIDEGSDTNGETLWGWAWLDEQNDARWTRRMPTLSRKQIVNFALWCCLPGNPGSQVGEHAPRSGDAGSIPAPSTQTDK